MTLEVKILLAPAAVNAMDGLLRRAFAAQAGFAEGMLEADRRRSDQGEKEWTEGLELVRKFSSNDTTAEKRSLRCSALAFSRKR